MPGSFAFYLWEEEGLRFDQLVAARMVIPLANTLMPLHSELTADVPFTQAIFMIDREVGLIRERVPVIDHESDKITELQRDGRWAASWLSERMSIVCPLARHVSPCR